MDLSLLVDNLQSADMRRLRRLLSTQIPESKSGNTLVFSAEQKNARVAVTMPDAIDVRETIAQGNDAVRACLTRCLVAEHALLTCGEPDVAHRTTAYIDAVEELELNMQRALCASIYGVSVNQVASRVELQDVSRERERWIARRAAAFKHIATSEPGVNAIERYQECTQNLTRLRAEHELVTLSEIRQMILTTPHFHDVESEQQHAKRMRNVEMKKKVKTALMSRAECMKRKKADIMSIAEKVKGSKQSPKLTKGELCSTIVTAAASEDTEDTQVNTQDDDIASPSSSEAVLFEPGGDDVKIVKMLVKKVKNL